MLLYNHWGWICHKKKTNIISLLSIHSCRIRGTSLQMKSFPSKNAGYFKQTQYHKSSNWSIKIIFNRWVSALVSLLFLVCLLLFLNEKHNNCVVTQKKIHKWRNQINYIENIFHIRKKYSLYLNLNCIIPCCQTSNYW